MPRYNVEHNGKWACFSSICDDFITTFMEKDEYEQWRDEEHGYQGIKPPLAANYMSMKSAVFVLTLNRTREDTVRSLMDTGLTETESEQLVGGCETEYYSPVPQDDGTYRCPNCRSTLTEWQTECKDESCCIRLVWR